MKHEEIERLANGEPPKGGSSETITWLAKEVLRLREELMEAYKPETNSDHDL